MYMFELIKPAHAAINIGDEYAFGGITSFGQMISILTPYAFALAGIITVVYFIIGAFEMIISFGDKNAVSAAKDKMMHAIIGFILILAMFVIFRALPYLLQLNNFNIIGR